MLQSCWLFPLCMRNPCISLYVSSYKISPAKDAMLCRNVPTCDRARQDVPTRSDACQAQHIKRCQRLPTGARSVKQVRNLLHVTSFLSSLNLAAMAINCLPSEVLESILQRLATQAVDPKLAAQDVACAAQVNKEWRAQVATRCWHVLLKKKLLIEVPCAADEALWLLHYLRGEQRPTIGFTAAKRIFKLNSRCLAPLSAIHHGPRQRRYKAGDLVELILKRHGSISAFRERVWKCTSVAAKAAKTSVERGVERRRLIDEAMAPFSNFIRRALHRQVEGYVKKNELSLDWIVKDASDMWWRQQDLDGMLHSMDLRDARFLREDGLSYVKGNLSRGFVLQEIARHAALTEALQDKGLRVDSVHVRSGVCRTYVVAGGDLTTCVERALQPR